MLVKTNEDQLILQSFLTVQFLEALFKIDFLKSELYESLVSRELVSPEFSEAGIGNQGTLLMVLYALLVIPRESVDNEFVDEYKAINNWLGKNAKISSTYKSTDAVRHVRNAVAHANV